MIPTSFAESNDYLSGPSDMTVEQCAPLSVLRGVFAEVGLPAVISCWKLTKEELDEINRTGRVWLTVYGLTMPPVALTIAKPFGSQEPPNER